MTKHPSNEHSRKWAILENFLFAYITQPPREYWDDVAWMCDRDILVELIGSDIIRTDWARIMREYSHLRPVTLCIKHAKDFYDTEVQKGDLERYKALKPFFERADWLRSVMARPDAPRINLAVYYPDIVRKQLTNGAKKN